MGAWRLQTLKLKHEESHVFIGRGGGLGATLNPDTGWGELLLLFGGVLNSKFVHAQKQPQIQSKPKQTPAQTQNSPKHGTLRPKS